MFGFLRLMRFLFRLIINQKHPGKQIIMSLAFLLIGGLVCYLSIVGIALSSYLFILVIIGFIAALLGFVTLPEGIINASLHGWDGSRVRNTKSQPVEPKPLKYVPPKQHNKVAKSKSGRRASQGKQKKRVGQSK